MNRDEIKAAIRAKVVDAREERSTWTRAASRTTTILPATGLLDSNAILELVVWFESTYDFPIKQEEINIDNLGSIDAMADFLIARKG